ncbi:hypothetical protein ACX1DX_10725 [Tessaracoccus sp. Y36]
MNNQPHGSGSGGCCGHHGSHHNQGAAHDHHGGVVTGPGDEVVICAVRGNQTPRSAAEDAGLFRDHADRRYYFCCDHCAELFDGDPNAYQAAGAYRVH